jgi:hypothetical protein
MSLPVRHSAALALLPSPPTGGMVARVKRRFMEAPRAVGNLPGTAKRMSLKLQAGVAEFLLISRLRARSQPARPSRRQSDDVLQRGADMVEVTCKSWFPSPAKQRSLPAYGTRI